MRWKFDPKKGPITTIMTSDGDTLIGVLLLWDDDPAMVRFGILDDDHKYIIEKRDLTPNDIVMMFHD